MSRIGRMPIVVPAGVDVKIDGQHVTVKGGKAELSLDVHPDITVKLEDGQITVTRVGETAAKIRSLRVPDVYKGKGIKYAGEHLIIKEGKTGAKK